jgi:cysteine synthase B
LFLLAVLFYGKCAMIELQVKKGTSSSLLDAVGGTPLLELKHAVNRKVRVLAKAEWLNPGGSVKDRPAAAILRAALAGGHLAGGKALLDSTSGNMGISYAALGASLGVRVVLAVPASASPERMAILKSLGAELHLSDALEGSDGAILLARKMVAEAPEAYYYANQYNNDANWRAHYETTGPEVWRQTGGKITHFVIGLGTTGTLMGAGRYLREQNPDIKIIGFQPDAAFHGLEGLKHMPTAIPPGIYDPTFADGNLEVSTEDAHAMTRKLASQEGIFGGVSAGAAAVAALRVAADLQSGMVVTVFPDAAYKYLSENFWGFTK